MIFYLLRGMGRRDLLTAVGERDLLTPVGGRDLLTAVGGREWRTAVGGRVLCVSIKRKVGGEVIPLYAIGVALHHLPNSFSLCPPSFD